MPWNYDEEEGNYADKRTLAEIPRSGGSHLFREREKRTWLWLKEHLSKRKATEGGLSEMNERTLATAIKHCEEEA